MYGCINEQTGACDFKTERQQWLGVDGKIWFYLFIFQANLKPG